MEPLINFAWLALAVALTAYEFSQRDEAFDYRWMFRTGLVLTLAYRAAKLIFDLLPQ